MCTHTYIYIYLYVTIVHVLLLDHLVVKQHYILCCVQYILYLTMATSLISLSWPPVAGGCGGPKPPRRRVSFGTHHSQWDDVAAAADDDVVVVVVVSYCCFYLFQERMMAKTWEDLVPVSIILEGLLHALRSAPEAGSSLFGCSGGDCSTVNLCLLWG